MMRAGLDDRTAAVVNRASDAVEALAGALGRVACALEEHNAYLDAEQNGPRG